MDQVGPQNIFAMADVAGAKWIQSEIIPHIKTKVIILKPETSELAHLELTNALGQNYSNFGEERFVRLTAFKWLGILRAIRQTRPEGVVFSDLDVVWLKRPEIEHHFETGEKFVYCQDDTPKNSTRKHYCTGIMFWPYSQENVSWLEELFTIQKNLIRSGQLTPDEPTFNSLVISDKKFANVVKSLSNQKYVIGHRFFFSFSSKNFRKIIAYHANYVVGEQRKNDRMRAIILRSQKDSRWLIAYTMQLIRELSYRLVHSKYSARRKSL